MPSSALHLFFIVLINISLISLGYLLIKERGIILSWLIFCVVVPITCILFKDEPPVLKMVSIAATTFTCMKIITTIVSYKDRQITLKFHQWLLFCIGWAGMRAEPFENLGNEPLANAWVMIRFGISRVAAGAILIILASQAKKLPLNAPLLYIIIASMLLIALSLLLHFGILSISAGVWRLQGVNTYYLFKKPAASLTLAEFWGKRWNIAFIEMTAVAIFRPLRSKFGGKIALALSFLFSGLLHELAISIPVKNGYGLPTIYFMIQAIGLLIEKLFDQSGIFSQYPFIARLWVFSWLTIPLPLLFHVQFIKQIIWPVINFLDR